MKGPAPQTLLQPTWDNYNTPQQKDHKKFCHIFQTVPAPSASHSLWMTRVAIFFGVNIPPVLGGVPSYSANTRPLVWLLTRDTEGPGPGSVLTMKSDKLLSLLLSSLYKQKSNEDSSHTCSLNSTPRIES